MTGNVLDVNSFMSTRILITGGFGYLGGRLGQFLATQGDYYIFLGSRDDRPVPNWLPQSRTVQIQWCSQDALDDVCRGMDVIIHCAGMNAQDCDTNPIAALEFNALGTARLLQSAIRQGVKRFIYFSTAHVYGSPLVGDITEKTSTTSLHPYATSHRAAEDSVRYANDRKKIEGIVIRLSNVFGPPVYKEVNCWMLLVNDLCRQIISTKKMILTSTGLQRRDFVPLTEVCRVIQHLLLLPKEKMDSCLFNVGGSWAPTVLEMAMFIQERCAIKLNFLPAIEHKEPVKEEKSYPLSYRVDTLFETGFQNFEDRTAEMDNLIEFCNVRFA